MWITYCLKPSLSFVKITLLFNVFLVFDMRLLRTYYRLGKLQINFWDSVALNLSHCSSFELYPNVVEKMKWDDLGKAHCMVPDTQKIHKKCLLISSSRIYTCNYYMCVLQVRWREIFFKEVKEMSSLRPTC